MDQNNISLTEPELDIKQEVEEVEDFDDITPIITSVKSEADCDAAMEVRLLNIC